MDDALGFDTEEVIAARRKVRQSCIVSRYASGVKNENGHKMPEMDVGAVHGGVTTSWLSQVFNKNPSTVKKLLADCPPIFRRKAGFVYDLKIAARFLVDPYVDKDKFFKNLRPDDLPVKMQDKYWAAKARRLKYEEEAGELWRTEKVQVVVGEMFQSIKFTIQLWADNIDRTTGISAEQRKVLEGMTDQLQQDIYEKVAEMCKAQATAPVLGEDDEEEPIEDLIG